MLLFGRQTSKVFDFGNQISSVNLKKAIDRAVHPLGLPDLTNALQEAKTIFDNSGRPEARKILVIIRDKRSNSDPKEVKLAADALYNSGVEVIPVFLGREDNSVEYEKMTPDKKRMLLGEPDVYPEPLAKAILRKVLIGKIGFAVIPVVVLVVVVAAVGVVVNVAAAAVVVVGVVVVGFLACWKL